MKKLILISSVLFVLSLWLASLTPSPVRAQVVVGNYGLQYQAGSPAGRSCGSTSPMIVDTNTGFAYSCQGGSYALLASGGSSGTVSGQALNVFSCGTSATVIGNQCHMDDGVTTAGIMTGSEPIADATHEAASATGNASFLGGQSGTNAGQLGGAFLSAANNAGAGNAGSVEIMPGLNSGSGTQGLFIEGRTFLQQGTVTQWNIECGVTAGAWQATDCAAIPVTPILGVAVTKQAGTQNTVYVAYGASLIPINASAAVTIGHAVCAGTSAGKVTDAGATTGCTVGQQVGIVIATSGTYTLPDGSAVTLSTILPLVSVNSLGVTYSGALAINTIPKESGSTNGTLTASAASDQGSVFGYTGVGGFLSNPASVAGAFSMKQGTTEATETTAITHQAPTAVTSYIITEPGTGPANNSLMKTYSALAASVTTESFVQAPRKSMLTSAYTNATNGATTIFSFAVDASTSYTIHCKGLYQAAATGAFVFTITGPASPTLVTWNHHIGQSVASNAVTYNDYYGTGATYPSGINTTAVGTSATDMPFEEVIGYTNGVTAGTISIQGATIGTATLTVEAGSWCVAY